MHQQRIKTLLRAGGITAAVLALIGGVTFAILQSQQVKLTGNMVQTAVADLQLSPDGGSNNYGPAQSGYVFSNLVPGGQAMPSLGGYSFYLKNFGGTPLALRLAVTSTPSNPNNVDLSKVNVILTPLSSGGQSGQAQTFTLQALIAAASTGGVTLTVPSQLNPNVTQQYAIQVSMTSDAITGPSATLGNIDFGFTGVVLGN